ncbi:MAG: M48 family metalloprotease [Pyrinomonadaceae bacterium]|nr:M48 family metalloprotease [Pyrinomonadaceae bacterium]
MLRSSYRKMQRLTVWLMAVAVFAMPLSAFGQTQIKAPGNKYSLNDDVQAGRQAAQEVERQMPMLRDGVVDRYVEEVGRRLVAAIPQQFQHSQFRYSFGVVNARDINAFALPGGPMYVNRGMIEAARTEGEMAGVMAHEISHVALRHGTAQATKAQKFQWGAIAGAIAGAVIGGPAGSIIGQGSQMAIGTYFLKYSREYERQADILGAQIMARAGYDPRDLANMFRTIEQQGGGSRGPEWMSSHPNPGNRYEAIAREAQLLRVSERPREDSREFQRIQARLRGMSRAPSMQEIAQKTQQNPNNGNGNGNENTGGTYSNGNIELPSTRYRTYTGGNLFRVSVPANWREMSGGQNSIMFAPEGAYGNQGITHGLMIGIEQAQGRNLQESSDAYIRGLLQNNAYLRQQSGYARASLGGRNALGMQLAGRSDLTGRNEIVTVYTTLLRDGNLFYFITISPQNERSTYNGVFNNVMRSLQLNG